MSRKIAIALACLLLLSVPARAQSDDPPATSLVHVVQRGETLFTIAQQYGVTVEAITHANSISDPRQIYVGQQLVIPDGEGTVSQATLPYVVQAGDTLVSIARRYGTTWQTLVHINRLLSPNAIYVGQVIQVPEVVLPAGGGEAASAVAGGGAIYVVRSQDVPTRIALRYGTSRWALAASNHLDNPALIYPGQELLVPGEGPGLLPAPFVSVEVRPLPVAQGATMIVEVHVAEPVTLDGRVFEGQFGQEALLPVEAGVHYWLVGVEARVDPGLYELELAAVDRQGQETSIATAIVVQSGNFGYERIDLPEDRIDLFAPDAIAAERELLYILRQTFTSERLWSVPFERPCAGTISAYFGTRRAYDGGSYDVNDYHRGVDFRAPAGTPVYASAAGTVLLAEPLALYGNMVVLDHGWGVLTGYGHLSSFEVQVGQQVAAGDLIAKVGNTGLSTGAHLHWEVWVGGISVDGLQWLEELPSWPEATWMGVGG